MLLKHRVETSLQHAATDPARAIINCHGTTRHFPARQHVTSNTVYNVRRSSPSVTPPPPRHLRFHKCKHRLYMYTKRDDREALHSTFQSPSPRERCVCQLQELLQWLQITEILHGTKRDETSIRKSMFPFNKVARCPNLGCTTFTWSCFPYQFHPKFQNKSKISQLFIKWSALKVQYVTVYVYALHPAAHRLFE